SAARGVFFGEVLIENGLVTAADLFRILQQNLAKKLLDLFTWTEGEFRWVEDAPAAESSLKVKVPQLILTGVSKLAPQEEVDMSVAPLVGKKLVLHPSPPFPFDELRLNAHQTQIAGALQPPGRRMGELAELTRLPVDEITRALYALSILGVVTTADLLPKEPPRPRPLQPPGARAPAAAGPGDRRSGRRARHRSDRGTRGGDRRGQDRRPAAGSRHRAPAQRDHGGLSLLPPAGRLRPPRRPRGRRPGGVRGRVPRLRPPLRAVVPRLRRAGGGGARPLPLWRPRLCRALPRRAAQHPALPARDAARGAGAQAGGELRDQNRPARLRVAVQEREGADGGRQGARGAGAPGVRARLRSAERRLRRRARLLPVPGQLEPGRTRPQGAQRDPAPRSQLRSRGLLRRRDRAPDGERRESRGAPAAGDQADEPRPPADRGAKGAVDRAQTLTSCPVSPPRGHPLEREGRCASIGGGRSTNRDPRRRRR